MALRHLLIIFGVIAIGSAIFGLIALNDAESSRSETVVEGQTTKRAAETQILVARHDIPAGTLIAGSDLAWTPAKGSAPLESFVREQDEAFPILGAVARRDIRQGDIVSIDHVSKPSDRGFLAAVLSPGMRAMSIAVDAVTGNAGLISPGDRVDVLLMQLLESDNPASPRKAVAETILLDRRVIATDQRVSGLAPVEASSETSVPSTITLEVDPAEAQLLSVAMRIGTLDLALRSATDPVRPGEELLPPASWASDVSPVLKQGKRAVRTRQSGPVVLRGGKDQPTVPLEN